MLKAIIIVGLIFFKKMKSIIIARIPPDIRLFNTELITISI